MIFGQQQTLLIPYYNSHNICAHTLPEQCRECTVLQQAQYYKRSKDKHDEYK
tara:strand:- start:655 stop:810 length:156 start_codon:yes stop_codon:yes gene_type:complete